MRHAVTISPTGKKKRELETMREGRGKRDIPFLLDIYGHDNYNLPSKDNDEDSRCMNKVKASRVGGSRYE